MIADEALGILKSIPPFDRLRPDEMAGLAASVTESRVVPGQVVVREGETGDRMYLIAEGSLQVLGHSFDGSEMVLARLEAGQHFGEQALLPSGSARRNATIRSITRCRLLELRRDRLLAAIDQDGAVARLLGEAGEQQRRFKDSRLREGVLRKLGVGERYRLETFAAGDYVFREGESADRLYLLLSGSARVARQRDGAELTLAYLLPGQFFGELAILNDQPRAASVRAASELQLASLDAAWFRSTLADNPQLQSIMQSLHGMYLMPSRGLLTLQTGQLATYPSLTAIHDLPDGRRVISTRLVGMPTFTSRVVGATEPDRSARYEDAAGGATREVHVAGGVIVELESNGEWRELGDVFEMLLDGAAVDDAWLDRFELHGGLHRGCGAAPRRKGLVCACAGASAEDIERAIETGCHSVELVAARTRATLVCGGCLPSVKELLGQGDWTPARCESITPLTEEVRAFRIRPVAGGTVRFHAGQHLVVQARIGTHWVQRPYTLSAAPGDESAYEIIVKREPEGVFSRWLFEREAGDALLRISTPGGNFHLPPERPVDIVCLVGGIGVTPALAMARTLALTPGLGRLHIDYSVSTEDQAIRLDELRRIAAQHPEVSVNLRVTRRDGRLGVQAVAELAASRPRALFYLCGSADYMRAVADHLVAAGVEEVRIHQERFTVAGERVPEPDCAIAMD